ncbi:MAG TPA: hypothetical protein VGL81_30940 [Polyangiaceae bacterium]|jgi:hypothetical protein
MASSIASSLAALLASALLATASTAAADPSPADRTLAQSLFEEGRKLMDAGRYEQACPRFADSQHLDPGGGTVLNLALCYEKLGALAMAYGTYNDALSFAIAEHRREREDFARQRIAALGPRVPRLTLHVAQALPGLVIQLDGNPLPASAWGIAAPVDPGRHTVDAQAPGFAAFQAILTLVEGQSRDLAVALAPEHAAQAPLGNGVAPPHVVKWRSPAFYALGGLAVASLATSVVTGVMALTTHNTVQQECSSDRDYCSSPGGPGDASRATTLAWVSTITLGGAVVAGVVAIVLPLAEHEVAGLGLGRNGALLSLAY